MMGNMGNMGMGNNNVGVGKDDYIRGMLKRNDNIQPDVSEATTNLDNTQFIQLREIVKKQIHAMHKTRILHDKTDEFKNTLLTNILGIIELNAKNLEVAQQRLMAQKMLDFIWGLGPLEKLLEDASITEIMVTRFDKIYVEQKGKLQLLDNVKFDSEEDLRVVIDKIVQPIGRTIDESKPIVDARLEDGSRVHAVIPPICPDGSLLTIRKFSKKKLTGEDYLRFGSLNEKMVDFLERAVHSRFNIIVSGGTGTGKTTLLNMLSNFIPAQESLITVEDSCELILGQDNVRRMEARPANAEGKGAVTIRDCVKATLRMRPDRIIVGEIRDGVIVDMFRALSSGHDGGLTTIHANNPEDLTTSVMPILFGMSDMSFTEEARNKLIASALDLIVQITRFSDGSRKISKITHVVGIGKKQARLAGLPQNEIDEIEDNEIILRDIFVFKQTGKNAEGKIVGEYVTTGYVPQNLLYKFELDGNSLPGGEKFFTTDSNDNMEYLSMRADKMGVSQEELMRKAEVVSYPTENTNFNNGSAIPDLSPTNSNTFGESMPDLTPNLTPDLTPNNDVVGGGFGIPDLSPSGTNEFGMPDLSPSNNNFGVTMPDLSPSGVSGSNDFIPMPDLAPNNFSQDANLKNDNLNNTLYNNEQINNIGVGGFQTEGFENAEINSTTLDFDALLKSQESNQVKSQPQVQNTVQPSPVKQKEEKPNVVNQKQQKNQQKPQNQNNTNPAPTKMSLDFDD